MRSRSSSFNSLCNNSTRRPCSLYRAATCSAWRIEHATAINCRGDPKVRTWWSCWTEAFTILRLHSSEAATPRLNQSFSRIFMISAMPSILVFPSTENVSSVGLTKSASICEIKPMIIERA